MITISSTTNSVIFTFDDNQHYLNNGVIEVPKNSLALVVDDSDMVTFKKADSNDIFLSITLDELDMTKEEVISFYQSDMTGGGGGESGVTSGEVQTMISEAVSGKADSSAVTEEISAAVSGKADSSAVTQEITAAVSGKADSSSVTEEISEAVSGKADTSAVTEAINAAVSGKADTSTVEALSGQVIDDELVITNGFLNVNAQLSGKADSSAVTQEITAAVSGKADSSSVVALSGQVTANTASITNKADTSALTSHTSDTTIHVTAADKQSWNAKLDSSALAPYYTSAQTDSAITQATSGLASNSDLVTLSGQVEDDELVIVNGFLNVNAQLSGKADSSAVTQEISAAVSGKVDTSAVTTAITSGSTDSQVPSAKAVYDQLGGVKIVALSQQAYDALAPDYDANTLYIINS